MQLITEHIQVFVSLVVILGAAVVALVCDLLKTNNESLREMNAELRARFEVSQPMFAMAGASAPQLESAASTRNEVMVTRKEAVTEERIPAESAQPALDRAAELATRRGVRRQAVVAEEPEETLAATGASLAEARQLARELMGRSAQKTRTENSTPAAQTDTVIQPEVVVESPAPAQSGVRTATSRKDWGSILNKRRDNSSSTVTVEAAPKPRLGELIPFETIQNSSSDLSVPAGFHEGMMLARILNGAKAVRGLVIVIGLNNFASRRHSGELGAETMSHSVGDHLRSILRANDFACQSSDDEFLMICPDDRDVQAQRRLNDVAESLWDYQLRAVGTSEILLSWGGVEAKGEPLADVLAAAADRMRETRRSRRSLGIAAPQKKAV